jgi:dihydropyrimidinase
MSTLLIKNGQIINHDQSFQANIFIRDQKIEKLFSPDEETPEAEKILDAKGKLIFPGAIDAHVHLDLSTPAGPSSDDFYTGTRAAIAGGTTSIIDFVTPNRNESLLKALKKRRKDAEKSLIDYSFHMGITWWNNSVEEEIAECIRQGITSFKCYLAYQNSIGINYQQLEKVMNAVQKQGGMVTIHCEEDELIQNLKQVYLKQGLVSPLYHALSRPPQSEYVSVEKVLKLAEKTSCKTYLVHISTRKSAELIENAQHKGVNVLAETCPQYLLLDESVYHSSFYESAPYVISPPIRGKCDQDGLWSAINRNVFSVIATDHCPFNVHGQKDAGRYNFSLIPNGAGGIEFRQQLIYSYGVQSGRMNLNQFVALTASNPASIFGIQRKGIITEGYDADLVLWNPETISIIEKETQYQHCDSNIFHNFALKGEAETVIIGGKIVYNHHQFSPEQPNGNELFRKI